MTPKQANLAIEGHHMQERRDWQRTLRITNCLGDDASVDDLYAGGRGAGRGNGMTAEKYDALKKRMSYADSSNKTEETP